jgi:RimJ/RimL family protein N-acetyltransferase
MNRNGNPEAIRKYPREVQFDGGKITLRYMRPADRGVALTFARALPPHDLLFLRRDITQPEVIDFWVDAIDRGRIVSIFAESAGAVAGYGTVDLGELSWSPHVAELRVMVSPQLRGKGLGQILTQEAFAIALGMGIEKMVAQMTADQKRAIDVFVGLGFRPEALLRDHVKDREGKKHDLVIMAHDVAKFHAQREALGITKLRE